MLSLYARKNARTEVLELMESQPISLSFQFQELQNVNSPTGSFSQSFRLPATSKNADFFDHAEDPDYVLYNTSFNPKTKYEAWIADDGVPIMHGSMQLIQVIKRNGRASEYEVIVVGNTGDLITEIRNLKLSDLDLSDLDHRLSDTELGLDNTSSYFQGDGLLKGTLASGTEIDSSWDGHFAYGFFDNRANQLEWDQQNAYPTERLIPFMKIWKVLDKIMRLAGYTYNSDFFGSTGEGYKVWMPVYNGHGRLRLYETSDVETTSYGATTDVDEIPAFTFQGQSYPELDGWYQAPVQGATRYLVPFPYDPSVTFGGVTGSDAEGMIDSDGVIVIQTPGIYRFRIETTWRIELNNSYVSHALKRMQGDDYAWQSNLEDPDPTIVGDTYQLAPGQQTRTIQSEYISCSAGDKFYMVIFQGFPVSNDGTWDDMSNKRWVVQSDLEVKSMGGTSVEDSLIDTNANMPDMTLVDWLSGIQKTFNLVFVPDEDRKHFTIEPANDFLYSGDFQDWHDKVDYGADVVIKPTTDLQSRKYNFEHAEGANYVNVSFQETALRVPGRYKVEDTENDWATGQTDITNGFAPFTPTRGTDNLYLFQNYDGSGEQLTQGDQPPMLCYGSLEDAQLNDGLAHWFFKWNYYSNSGIYDSTSLEEIMIFSPFSDFPAQLSSKALLYGEDRFAEEDTQPVNTLFREYWEDYFLEQYSTEARIMECRMFLTKADINQLNFADTIRLNEGTFRLLSVSNYTANAEEPCRVTLIRAVTDIRPCEYVPSGFINFGSQVTFTDSDGNTGQVGTKKCCEYYGHNWSGNRCLKSLIDTPSLPTQGGVLGDVYDALGGNNMTRLPWPVSFVNQVLNIEDGKVTTLPIPANSEIIQATNIKQTSARNFASTTQLNKIASNEISINGHNVSIANIESKTDYLTITSNHNLDTTKSKVGYITTGVNGISGFTIAPTAKPLTADQVSTTSTTNKFVTQADKTKLGYIGVSSAINLDSIDSRVSTNESDITSIDGDITSIQGKTDNLTLGTSGKIASIGTDFNGNVVSYIPAYSQWLYTAIPPASTSSGKYVSTIKVLDLGSSTATEDASLYQIHHLLNGNYADAGTCPSVYSYACNQASMLDPLNPNDATHRSGQSGVRLVTIDNTGKLSEISDGTSGFFLKTDGSGSLSWGKTEAGWHNSATNIKVLPHEWTMNDDYNRAPIMVEDDTTNTLGIKMPASATEAYAMIPIPLTYDATHVQVYASASTASAVEVYSYNHTTGAIVSKGSGAFNSSIDITDVSSSATQNLCIKIIPASTTTLIYGADVTIA